MPQQPDADTSNEALDKESPADVQAKLPRLYSSKIRDVSFGVQCIVVEPSNLYECVVGDNVFIGPFVEIQSNVRIGDNSRIQSHSFVCSLVTIGRDCFVGHGVMFINDKFSEGRPEYTDKSKWLPTILVRTRLPSYKGFDI